MLLGHAEDNLVRTENNAEAFRSTKDPRVDFFFEVMKGTPEETVRALLDASWPAYPLDTLKLIFHLRSVRVGKGEREGFLQCLDWLRERHPRTMLHNLRHVPEHGYWKDLANWVVLVCLEGQRAEACRPARKERSGAERADGRAGLSPEEREERRRKAIEEAAEHNRKVSSAAREQRRRARQERLEHARRRFSSDPAYRDLHIEVARLFASALQEDLKKHKAGKPVSLVAKWCPSLCQYHDKYTLLSTTIAQLLYPSKLEGESDQEYVSRIRDLLRKEYYVPLRKATPVVEVLMSAGEWEKVVYERVPSVAMKNNKEIFVRHDEVRFGEYLGAVERGEKKIASQALLPHHLVRETYSFLDESASSAAARTTEAQWAAYVESLRKSGTLDSSMAVCDVSGSMSGEPMEVAIALSLLTSQISQPPFNKVIITFSEKPQIHHIKGSTLTAMVTDIMQTESGLNTNFQAVFEKILGLAKENKLKAEDMIKVLFVFSDMEFDEARGERTDLEPFTNYNVVKRMYEREGYVLPQIVFWNLRGGRGVVSKPVLASQSGVAMISGFSGMLMKVFLEGGDLMKELNPVRVLEKSINTKAFSKLKVID